MGSQRLAGRLVALVVIDVCVLAVPAAATSPGGATVDQSTHRLVAERLDRMPLLFVPEPVSPEGTMGFAVRGREASIWLSETGIAYRLARASEPDAEGVAGSWVVALDLVGATPRQPVGEDPLPTRVSYFKGPKERWRTGLPSYGSVRYHEPWPGVDVLVSGTAGKLESTFVVRPGADSGVIRLAYRGASPVRLDADGSLVIETPLGEIRERPPFAYQDIDGQRVEVAATFELEDGSEPGCQTYRFRLGQYDPKHELVLDPVTLIYCGYIGGLDYDVGNSIAVDAAGRAYVAGHTLSTQATFPVTIGPDLTHNGGEFDAFVARVNASGTALEYCGYIGGAMGDVATAIVADSVGRAYLTGYTASNQATFPVTVGPDLTYNGSSRDAFVARVNPSGTALDYCGYIGGTGIDEAYAIEADAAGSAYVVGSTLSTESTFPVAVGPDLSFNGGTNYGDGFVAKVNPEGTALDYCGYIGGSDDDSATDLAIDSAGAAYITGWTGSNESTFPIAVGPDLSYNGGADAFVAKVLPSGAGLGYCGYVGGAMGDGGDATAVDAAGNAYIAGRTSSDESTFPVAVGPDLTYNGGDLLGGDVFVARISATGTTLDYCGYIGGTERDFPSGIAVDSAARLYVVGYTDSTETSFPVAVGPDLTYNGGRDAFVARVDTTGIALDFCGYIGGSGLDRGNDIAIDSKGNAYLIGSTNSPETSFPVNVGPDLTYNGGNDAFVVKVSGLILADGFESGDTSAWSATVP